MGTHPIFESDFDCLTVKSKISLDFEVILPQPTWADKNITETMPKEQNECNDKDDPNYCFRRFIQVIFVTSAIVFLIGRSCYTVYWEERQKRKRKKALDLEKSNSGEISSSKDNLFQETESEITPVENSAFLTKKTRSRAFSFSRTSSSRTRPGSP